MEIKIQALHFNATEELHHFIEKKIGKLEKINEKANLAEVTLSIVKPAEAQNKKTAIHLLAPGLDIYADKTCDTFEEGVDLCVDILKRKIEKAKEK